MAMKKEYLSVDGEIFGEVTGGVVNFYDRDALGSVVAIEDGAGNTVSTIEYKPFGDVRTYTRENPLAAPRRFLWCGTHGYRFNERYAQYTSHYVRVRHYSSLQGMWSTVDPVYPSEKAYGYVENKVCSKHDYLGLSPSMRQPPGRPSCTKAWNEYIYYFCNRCYFDSTYGYPCGRICDALASEYYRSCNKKGVPSGGFRPPLSGRGDIAPRTPNQNYYLDLLKDKELSPFTFKYGNCCGLTNKCNCRDAQPGGRAIDCLDQACAEHDECLATMKEYLNPFVQKDCARKLCAKISLRCDCNEYAKGSKKYSDCKDAMFNMQTLYCAIGNI